MVDPNRKINLNASSSSSDDETEEEDDLNEEHVKMIKEFEQEFKDRFTERDEEFMNFCKQKPKPPIIVYPFDMNFYNNRGPGGGGSRNQRNNFHRHNHHHQRNNSSGSSSNNSYHHYQNRRNFNPNRNRYDGGGNRDNKRFRHDDQ